MDHGTRLLLAWLIALVGGPGLGLFAVTRNRVWKLVLCLIIGIPFLTFICGTLSPSPWH
jgi:hypothetical protein